MNELDSRQGDMKQDFMKVHQEHTNTMRDKQRDTLENMVNNLNTKLKDLVNAADLLQSYENHNELISFGFMFHGRQF